MIIRLQHRLQHNKYNKNNTIMNKVSKTLIKIDKICISSKFIKGTKRVKNN